MVELLDIRTHVAHIEDGLAVQQLVGCTDEESETATNEATMLFDVRLRPSCLATRNSVNNGPEQASRPRL